LPTPHSGAAPVRAQLAAHVRHPHVAVHGAQRDVGALRHGDGVVDAARPVAARRQVGAHFHQPAALVDLDADALQQRLGIRFVAAAHALHRIDLHIVASGPADDDAAGDVGEVEGAAAVEAHRARERLGVFRTLPFLGAPAALFSRALTGAGGFLALFDAHLALNILRLRGEVAGATDRQRDDRITDCSH